MKPSVKAFTRGLVLVVAASLPLLATTARAAEGAAQLGPQELVTKVAQDTLRDLDAHRSEYQKNPNRVRELVDKNMLPHFDTAYAAQLVLAKHWRTANADQRKRFVEAFYQSLLQNYGEALLEFTPDRLKILPFQGKADDKVVTVRSEVRRDNGQRVPVNYSLRQTPDGWKAYDVQIEGVSYVKSFRTDFGSEIQQKGLEPVIQRLEQQVASGTVQKPGAPAGIQQTCVREEVVKERVRAGLGSSRWEAGAFASAACSTPPRRAKCWSRASRASRRARRSTSISAASARATAPGWRCSSSGCAPRVRAAGRSASPTCRRRSRRWRESAKWRI